MTKSMFDEHQDKIIKWCSQGVPVKEMVKMLGGYYTHKGLYAYIRSHKLMEKSRALEARNKCNECEYCHKYKNIYGEYVINNRICALSWRTIQAEVVHCPRWCEKEKSYDNT